MVCLVGAAVLVPHLRSGGFHADDWVDAGNYYFHPGHGFWAAFHNYQGHRREAYELLRTATYTVFGMHPARHLALTALVAVLECATLVVIVRRLAMPVGPAVMAGLLLLLLPDADSTRLWANGVQMELFSGLLPLAGLLIALSGMRRSGWRAAVAHLPALLVYGIAVNGYELGAPMIALFVFAYARLAGGFRRAVLVRWGADAAVVLAVLVHYSLLRGGLGSSQVPKHVRLIVSDGLGVAARALVPVRGLSAGVVLIPALVVVLAAIAAWRDARVSAGTRAQLGSWLWWLAAGVAVTAAGWVMIIPGALGYDPGSFGVGNRINAVAAIGLAVAVVGFCGLLAVGLRALLRRARGHSLGLRTSAAVLATLAVVPVVATDLVRFREDASNWERAGRQSWALLDRLHRMVPDPRPGTTLFTFGVSGYSAPSVPIFGGGGNDDLVGAVRVSYRMASISGFPVLGGMHFSCAPRSITLLQTGVSSTTSYGLALLLDLDGSGRVIVPHDERDCLRDTAALAPYAPVNEGP